MSHLRSQFHAVIGLAMTIVTVLHLVMVYVIVPNLPSTIKNLLQLVGTPSMTLVGVSILYLYDKHFWRLFNSERDFAGLWRVRDKFFSKRDGSEKVESKTLRTIGFMHIRQTAMSIRITEGTTKREEQVESGEYCTKWHSSCCDLTDDNAIIAGLVLDRSLDESVGPTARHAYEEIHVEARDRFGRPTVLTSKTYHCIAPGEVPWITESIYKRDPLLHPIYELFPFPWNRSRSMAEALAASSDVG